MTKEHENLKKIAPAGQKSLFGIIINQLLSKDQLSNVPWKAS
jgi:hypothetical protein